MKKIKFSYDYEGYKCSELGEMEGYYYPAEMVDRLVEAIKFVIKHYDPNFTGPSAWDELKAAIAPFLLEEK